MRIKMRLSSILLERSESFFLFGKKTFCTVLLIGVSLGLAGCGLPFMGKSKAFVRENVDFGFVQKIAVLPVENNSKDEFAPELVRDITITRILAMKLFDVTDKGLVDSFLREEAIDPGKPLDAGAIKRLGQKLNVQSLLLTTLDLAAESRKGTMSYPEVSVTLRLLEVETGLVIWQAGGHQSGDSVWRRLFGLAGRDKYQVTVSLLEDILHTIPR
ncbi:MAG: hypothetical protein KKE83_11955 [Proteobacteria bacterium]|nr:hypothetical protein [Pseudomonadota bacterium]MBU1545692.1 hypothetical protein [Pseudomonadota bacterium]MBU2620386.1 hypothetical protein [Pseudomonadota bacterium]